VVVITTGSVPRRPWWDSGAGVPVHDVTDVLRGRGFGGSVLVVDELGFHQATSVAEWLAARGAKVTVAAPGMVVGQDLAVTLDMEAWWTRADAAGIVQRPSTMVAGSDESGVTLQNVLTGETELAHFDAVVMASPPDPYRPFVNELRAHGIDVRIVGDALAPRRAHAAVIDADRVAVSL
jgi:hypothetical protein